MAQTPFSKRSLFNAGDFGTLTWNSVKSWGNLWLVSVPLRGFWYSDTIVKLFDDYGALSFSPLAGIVVLNKAFSKYERSNLPDDVSVPLRGLWFLTAPLTDGFITPSKMAFAGRILFFCFFRDFLWKCLSQILQTRMFITSGQNVIKSIDLFILYYNFNLKEISRPPSYRHNKSLRKAMAASLRDCCPPMAQTPFLKGVHLTPGILVLWRGRY